jgi:hypothetical protein
VSIDQFADAWQQLENKLRAGSQEWIERSDGGRRAARTQLAAVEEFLIAVGPDRRWIAPLTVLLAALEDLDRGTVTSMIETTRLAQRPPETFQRNVTKCCAAAAIDGLMKLKLSRERAAKAVADVVGKSGYSFDGTRARTWQTVARWRDELNSVSRDGLDVEMVDTYRHLRDSSATLASELQCKIDLQEITTKEACDRILLILAAALMDHGEAVRPSDTVEALYQSIARRRRRPSRF